MEEWKKKTRNNINRNNKIKQKNKRVRNRVEKEQCGMRVQGPVPL